MNIVRLSGSSVFRYASVGLYHHSGSVSFKHAAFSQWQALQYYAGKRAIQIEHMSRSCRCWTR